MMSFLVFQLWAAFGIAVLTGIYYLLFRKETFYRFNRIYLVFSAILSMILPAIHLAPFQSDKGLLPVAIKSVTVMAYKVYTPGIEAKQTFHFLPLIYCDNCRAFSRIPGLPGGRDACPDPPPYCN